MAGTVWALSSRTSRWKKWINQGPSRSTTSFPRDFFDLIVIDECHRGSAAEDSAWREVLAYFGSAIQLGMTATPKETKYVSNIHYSASPSTRIR